MEDYDYSRVFKTPENKEDVLALLNIANILARDVRRTVEEVFPVADGFVKD